MADETPSTPRPDLLSRMPALMTALNPVLLLVIGYFLNAGITDANNEIAKQKVAIEELKGKAEELRTKADAASIATKTQVEKVNVILKLIEDLTGKNEERRRLAMQAVQIVLPSDEAVNILNALQRAAGPDNPAAAEARSILDANRARLLTQMFSDEQTARVEALRALQQAWYADDALVDQLIGRAMQDVQAREREGFPNPARPAPDPDTQRRASIFNTASFLASVNTSNPDLKRRMLEFAAAAERNSPDTAIQVRRIRTRLQ